MQEKRRHQRVKCAGMSPFCIGVFGTEGKAELENISSSGLMMRSDLQLAIGRTVGVALALPNFPSLYASLTVVSRLGGLVGARFRAGPLNQVLIDALIVEMLSRGVASAANVHEIGGRKILRVAGGLNESLTEDLIYFFERVGVDELDASEVTMVNVAGLTPCLERLREGKLVLRAGSPCFNQAVYA